MTLHKLSENDLSQILEWRNAPEVRRNMYSNHIITWEEHLAWFLAIQHDPTKLWYLYIQNEVPLGVVYFTSYSAKYRNAFWGFYASNHAPRGTGLNMEFDALEHAFFQLQLHKLNCEVIEFNKKVINMHKKCGFIEEGVFRDFYHDGERYHNVIRLGILDSEWIKCRGNLAERIKLNFKRFGASQYGRRENQ